ncbi:uncharacterized protein B0T15DRAFT_35832 [Chaetomium strumarium]|uniref:Uncharacterized protein n=1 Tax=Chaetomium strumarium TaxID=1170767 RepID=A0AAJ0H2N0_9PEZI|nr:hypothetical protein B0T15DRAFT_35832 [Chaetomium strumarium]
MAVIEGSGKQPTATGLGARNMIGVAGYLYVGSTGRLFAALVLLRGVLSLGRREGATRSGQCCEMICSAPGLAKRREGRSAAGQPNARLRAVHSGDLAIPLRIARYFSAAQVVTSRDDARIKNLKTVLQNWAGPGAEFARGFKGNGNGEMPRASRRTKRSHRPP